VLSLMAGHSARFSSQTDPSAEPSAQVRVV
jgi:hypothetical protein